MSNKKKIVLLGKSGVGKTSIILRYINKTFYENTSSTIGADFLAAEVKVNKKSVFLQVWDTAGQEIYDSLTPMVLNF